MATYPKPDNVLSPALAGKFELVGLVPGEIVLKGKTYDLRTISLKTTEELFEKHHKALPFLKKVVQPSRVVKDTGPADIV